MVLIVIRVSTVLRSLQSVTTFFNALSKDEINLLSRKSAFIEVKLIFTDLLRLQSTIRRKLQSTFCSFDDLTFLTTLAFFASYSSMPIPNPIICFVKIHCNQ